MVGSTPGRVAVTWLLLGWVTDCLRTSKRTIWVYNNYQDQLNLPSLRDR